MKILIVAAHPDDEVLGCGGTIARLTREGHEVHIALLGEGITSRYSAGEEPDRKAVEELHARGRQVGRLLGAREVFLFSLPDNRFDTIPLLDVVKIVESLISKLQPEVIYTHHGGDLNVDHQIVNRAVLTATRPVEGCPVKEIYSFEVASCTEWAFSLVPVFQPNVFVDIAETMEIKVRAMQLYDSEARSFPHPRSPEALHSMARRWGSTAGKQAAEAFQLIRLVR